MSKAKETIEKFLGRPIKETNERELYKAIFSSATPPGQLDIVPLIIDIRIDKFLGQSDNMLDRLIVPLRRHIASITKQPADARRAEELLYEAVLYNVKLEILDKEIETELDEWFAEEIDLNLDAGKAPFPKR